jgi:hypothetical protein
MCRYSVAQCTVVIGNVISYRRDYKVILFEPAVSFMLTGINIHLNPRIREVIQAQIFYHIFDKKFFFYNL